MKANLHTFQMICVAMKIGDTTITSEDNASKQVRNLNRGPVQLLCATVSIQIEPQGIVLLDF